MLKKINQILNIITGAFAGVYIGHILFVLWNLKTFDDYYRDTCDISKSNMIAFLQENSMYSLKVTIRDCIANIHIFVGEKENHAMRKSATIIHKKTQDSFLHVLPNMYHGEFSINHADDYVSKILEIVKQR